MPTKRQIRKSKRKTQKKSSKSTIKIAIPSHKRDELLQKYTFALLKKHNISFKSVYVFCSPESYKSYKKLCKEWGCHLIKSKKSIVGIRNHMIKYFKSGEQVVEMDDDIQNIVQFNPSSPKKPVEDLKQFMVDSFKTLGNKGLWGVNATTNSMGASGKDQSGLYFIVNSFCGYINDKRIRLTVEEKEDYDRAAQFYELDLPILKRGQYGINTNYWNNPGGIQDRYDKEKRKQVQKKSAETLIEKYPDMFRMNVRSNGIVDVRFRSTNPYRKA